MACTTTLRKTWIFCAWIMHNDDISANNNIQEFSRKTWIFCAWIMTHEDKKNLGFNKSFGAKPICPILTPEFCHSSSLFLVDMNMVVLPESFMLPIPTAYTYDNFGFLVFSEFTIWTFTDWFFFCIFKRLLNSIESISPFPASWFFLNFHVFQ